MASRDIRTFFGQGGGDDEKKESERAKKQIEKRKADQKSYDKAKRRRLIQESWLEEFTWADDSLPKCSVSINGHDLERVPTFVYLGIVFTPQLSFTKHIERCVSKANARLEMEEVNCRKHPRSTSIGSNLKNTDGDEHERKKRKKIKAKKEKKKKDKKSKRSKKHKSKEVKEESVIGPIVPASCSEIESSCPPPKKSKTMIPMTKEEWEKQQSVVRRVYDPDTGRNRLVKGDGEIIEEIVSYSRHKEINHQATKGDGAAFQIKMGLTKQ
ncbi:ADP-ribosylation factor-like protein 6-interacting protein 4 [Nymphon striatum]|nr:ADP-ribosylation factor-like protein 6-interacting protein 4 [Nymphon striatum]